eukprot:scaffold1170_cov174-Amphora_coffeaeformis.AAC.38
MRFSFDYCHIAVVLSLLVGFTNAFADSRGSIRNSRFVSEQTEASGRHHFRLTRHQAKGWARRCGHSRGVSSLVTLWGGGPRPPEKDPEEPLALVRVTTLVVQALTRPTAVASLPSGVVLALVALPLVASLSQTVLTLILFLALAILGRLAGTGSIDEDNENKNTSWTDVFALVFSTSTAYLVLPPSAESLDSDLLAGPFVGIALLGTTVAVLWQTTNAAQSSASEEDELEGRVNGVNGELLSKWDEEMKVRELQKGKRAQENEDE